MLISNPSTNAASKLVKLKIVFPAPQIVYLKIINVKAYPLQSNCQKIT